MTTVAAAAQPPAGGAELGQVMIATLGATIATGAMLWICLAHRSGRISWLGTAAAKAESATGVAGWAALPAAMLGVSLLTAVFGMYWDISLHLDNGRDAGPLANPAHYFILVGLFGVLFSGVLSIALTPKEKPSRSAIRLPNGWWAPLGAVMIVACATVSLIAFPLDDVWHRIFGQDVTLWGPTHLLLIGGASFAILGHWTLDIEGRRANPGGIAKQSALFRRIADVGLVGSLLVGLSTFQAEFDFGVPQFRLAWQPLLLALAAAMGLTAARIRLGRGGAIAAALFFIALRGLLALTVGPILGQTTPHFPLYLAEAALVELVALRVTSRRPIALGAVAGLLIGTVGFAAEYGWQALIAYIAWPPSLIVEGVVLATVAGVAGGVLGGFIGRSVTAGPSTERAPRWAVPAAGVAVVAALAWTLPMPAPSSPPSAHITLEDAASTAAPQGSGKRTVDVTAKLDPPTAANDARWFVVTAWQGKGAVVADMERVAPGVYRSAKPVPVGGPDWKSTLRLQTGREVLGVPVYLPEDDAIPAKGVPAESGVTRTFERDKQLLQREQKPGVPGALTLSAYLVVLLVFSTMIGIVAWGLARLGRTIRAPRPAREPASPTPTAGRAPDRTPAPAPRPKVPA